MLTIALQAKAVWRPAGNGLQRYGKTGNLTEFLPCSVVSSNKTYYCFTPSRLLSEVLFPPEWSLRRQQTGYETLVARALQHTAYFLLAFGLVVEKEEVLLVLGTAVASHLHRLHRGRVVAGVIPFGG